MWTFNTQPEKRLQHGEPHRQLDDAHEGDDTPPTTLLPDQYIQLADHIEKQTLPATYSPPCQVQWMTIQEYSTFNKISTQQNLLKIIWIGKSESYSNWQQGTCKMGQIQRQGDICDLWPFSFMRGHSSFVHICHYIGLFQLRWHTTLTCLIGEAVSICDDRQQGEELVLIEKWCQMVLQWGTH